MFSDIDLHTELTDIRVFYSPSHPFSSFVYGTGKHKYHFFFFLRTKMTAIAQSLLKFALEHGKSHQVRTIFLCIKAFLTVIS